MKTITFLALDSIRDKQLLHMCLGLPEIRKLYFARFCAESVESTTDWTFLPFKLDQQAKLLMLAQFIAKFTQSQRLCLVSESDADWADLVSVSIGRVIVNMPIHLSIDIYVCKKDAISTVETFSVLPNFSVGVYTNSDASSLLYAFLDSALDDLGACQLKIDGSGVLYLSTVDLDGFILQKAVNSSEVCGRKLQAHDILNISDARRIIKSLGDTFTCKRTDNIYIITQDRSKYVLEVYAKKQKQEPEIDLTRDMQQSYLVGVPMTVAVEPAPVPKTASWWIAKRPLINRPDFDGRAVKR